MKFVAANISKFKERKKKKKIMANSSKEEVKDFFEKSLEFTGELNNLDGKGLLELDEEGMKKLGLKYGQRTRLIKYIKYFKTLKSPSDEKVEEITISRESSEDEVNKFLKMRLKFSEDSINKIQLDAETLFDLKEEEIDDLNEITTEEKENLKKFLRGEFDKNEGEKEQEIKLDLNSSQEDIYNFLKKKLCFSDESIEKFKEQDLDVETFFGLTENEIKELEGISEIEKEKLNIYLNEYKKEKEESELKIDDKSSKEDVVKILKEKLNFSEKALKEWKLDGKSLLILIDSEIDKLNELSEEEKNELKQFLAEQKSSLKTETTFTKETIPENNEIEQDKEDNKNIKEPEDNKAGKDKKEEMKNDKDAIKLSKESKKEDIIQFLEKYNLKLENITGEDVDKMNDLKKEEKEIIKSFLKKDVKQPKNNIDNNKDSTKNSNIKRSNKIQDVLYADKKNFNPKREIKKRDKAKFENPNQKKGDMKDSEGKDKKKDDKILVNKIMEQHANKEEKSDDMKFIPIKKLEISPLHNAPNNIFFFITVSDIQSKSAEIAIYIEEGSLFSCTYYNLNFFLISKNDYKNDKKGFNYYYLFQVPSDKLIKRLSITYKKTKNGIEYNFVIDTNSINQYFYVYNIFDEYDDLITIEINSIFSEYFDYFMKKDDFEGQKLQKSLIKAIMSRISKENNFKIRIQNFLRILKLCSKFEVEVKNVDAMNLRVKNKLKPNYYITEEEIDKIISKKKQKIIEIITLIFAKQDSQYLMKLQ